jgi:hypothetical protein
VVLYVLFLILRLNGAQVNNAVWGKPGLAISSSEEDLHKTFAVGVFGPLFILQHAMPNITKGGRVINIGSVASQLGFPGTGIYGASKAAMDALTFTLAQEVRYEPLIPALDSNFLRYFPAWSRWKRHYDQYHYAGSCPD